MTELSLTLIDKGLGTFNYVQLHSVLTRKHSSRMRAARLPTKGHSVATVESQYQWARGAGGGRV